jgi:hypothetical protein
MSWKEFAERLFWTCVAAAGGVLLAAASLGLDTLQAAGTAALMAGVNMVTLEARRRSAQNESS